MWIDFTAVNVALAPIANLNAEQKNLVAAIASGAQSLSKISTLLPANIATEGKLIAQQGFVFFIRGHSLFVCF